MLFVPTVYGWPNVLIELARPWPVSVFFPLRDLRQPEVPHATDREVAEGLRALGDETRLQITRLVAEEPRSTKELAAPAQPVRVGRLASPQDAGRVPGWSTATATGTSCCTRWCPTGSGRSAGRCGARSDSRRPPPVPVPALPVAVSRAPQT